MSRRLVRAKVRARFAAAGVCAIGLTAVGDARGAEDAIELGASGAYATPPIRGGITPLGPGAGVHGGLVLGGFYAGLGGTYFLGGSETGVTAHAILVGGEIGYGLRLTPWLTLRPQIGVGDAIISHVEPPDGTTTPTTSGGRRGRGEVDVVSGASGTSGTTIQNVYVEPALVAVIADDAHFVSLGASALYAPNVTFANSSPATWLSFAVRANLGFVFDLAPSAPKPPATTAAR